LFERYQRSERALVATLAEMYVQGVSTRKVKAITEELWHAFSASSTINKRLDESLKAFACRPLQEPFPTSPSMPVVRRSERPASSGARRC
jgi:transposase-like protein